MADPALFRPEHDAVVSTTLDGYPIQFKVSEHKVGGLDLGELKDKTNPDGSPKYTMDSLVSTGAVSRDVIECNCDPEELRKLSTPAEGFDSGNPAEGGTA